MFPSSRPASSKQGHFRFLYRCLARVCGTRTMAHSQNTQQSVVCSSAPPFEHAAQLSHQKSVTGVVPERLGHCRHPLFESSTGLLRSYYKIGRRASVFFLYQYHFPNEFANCSSPKAQLMFEPSQSPSITSSHVDVSLYRRGSCVCSHFAYSSHPYSRSVLLKARCYTDLD